MIDCSRNRHGKSEKMCPDTHRSPPGRLARRRREQHRRSTYRCCVTHLPLDCCTIHVCVSVCLYVGGLRICTDSRCPFYLAVSSRLARGNAGNWGLAPLLLSSPRQPLRRRLGVAWLPRRLDCNEVLLPLTLAGPPGDLKDALLRSRLG